MISQMRVFSLFPMGVLPYLGRDRGRRWARLVEHIAKLPETHPEHMAYTLLVRRLAHHVRCTGGGLCVIPTCMTCMREILEHYKGSERDLMELYRHALVEVEDVLAGLERVRLAA